jgi:hypothetical protein
MQRGFGGKRPHCVGMTPPAPRIAIFRTTEVAVFIALALAPVAAFADGEAGAVSDDGGTTFAPDALVDGAAEASTEGATDDAEVSDDGSAPNEAALGDESSETDASGETSTDAEAAASLGDGAPVDAATTDAAPPPPWKGFDAGEGLLTLGQYPTWGENEDHDGFSCSVVRARLRDSSPTILLGAAVAGLYHARRRNRRR